MLNSISALNNRQTHYPQKQEASFGSVKVKIAVWPNYEGAVQKVLAVGDYLKQMHKGTTVENFKLTEFKENHRLADTFQKITINPPLHWNEQAKTNFDTNTKNLIDSYKLKNTVSEIQGNSSTEEYHAKEIKL